MHLRQSKRAARILPIIIVIGVLIGIGIFMRATIIRFAAKHGLTAQIPAPLVEPAQSLGLIVPTPEPQDRSALFSGDAQLAPDGFPVYSRKHVLKYTVQEGDSVFGIAGKFVLSPDTIFWANTDTLEDNINLLFVGVELYILPVDGVYHISDGESTIAKIAAQYSVSPGEILFSEYNTLSDENSNFTPPKGMHIVVPGGRREYVSWQAPIATGVNGVANPEGLVHPGSCRAQYIGTGGTGAYINPIGDVPYRITNGFASWHPGLDLAANHGTPIFSTDTGVVVFAGWHREGYGELVIIDHGNGWTSYYGHMSKRYVGCGDQVMQGQLIGDMGMSGNATGVHLHFEIRENDIPQNPTGFITFQDMREP